MRLLGCLIFILAFSAFAKTEYGTDNEDLTSITVEESSMQKCEENVKIALFELQTRGKMIYSIAACKELKYKERIYYFGHVRYHKYL